MHLIRPIVLCIFILSAGVGLCAPLEDARAYLRAGKRVQTFASIFEAIEKDEEAIDAKLLLDELKKDETSYSEAEAKVEPDIEDEALKNFKDGVILKENGDLTGAREKFGSAQAALRKFSTTPSFSGALMDAAGELKIELEKKYLPEIQDANDKILELNSLPAGEKTRALLEMEGRIKDIASALPENEKALRLVELFESELKRSAKNWIAAAMAAETLSGCGKAGRMYKEIAAVIQKRNGDEARIATEGAERCNGGK